MVRECKRCGALNEDVLENCVICAAILPRSVTAESRIRIDRRGIFTRGTDFVRYAMPLFIAEWIAYIILSPFQINIFFNKLYPFYDAQTNIVNDAKIASVIPNLQFILLGLIVISLVAFALMMKGFSMMRIIDSEYKTGMTGTYFLFFGLIILVPGTMLTLNVMQGYTQALSISANTPFIYGHYIPLLEGVGLLLFGGFIAVIGYIMVCLTIYKLGARFNSGPVKIGALFLFLISFLGGIILFFSMRSLKSKILGVKEELP